MNKDHVLTNRFFYKARNRLGIKEAGNIPTRLAPNRYSHPLPPTPYILLKKGKRYIHEGGLGQNPQQQKKRERKRKKTT